MSAARFIVSGKVQGVFFRASTREQAQRLGLRGYAKNLENGDVEVLAVGDHDAIDKIEAWLHHGPGAAHVAGVVRQPVEDARDAGEGFRIG